MKLLISESSSTYEAAAGLLRSFSAVNSYRNSVIDSGAIEEINRLLTQSSLASEPGRAQSLQVTPQQARRGFSRSSTNFSVEYLRHIHPIWEPKRGVTQAEGTLQGRRNTLISASSLSRHSILYSVKRKSYSRASIANPRCLRIVETEAWSSSKITTAPGLPRRLPCDLLPLRLQTQGTGLPRRFVGDLSYAVSKCMLIYQSNTQSGAYWSSKCVGPEAQLESPLHLVAQLQPNRAEGTTAKDVVRGGCEDLHSVVGAALNEQRLEKRRANQTLWTSGEKNAVDLARRPDTMHTTHICMEIHEGEPLKATRCRREPPVVCIRMESELQSKKLLPKACGPPDGD
ncbi:hypothetical protein VNO77_15082 [Canavalia gladiata]|uniref:Uncharacterized protein n=1 Tax=Canavalia gladiata TaxID=3824 RepID=A0AAN9LZ84_CANGL